MSAQQHRGNRSRVSAAVAVTAVAGVALAGVALVPARADSARTGASVDAAAALTQLVDFTSTVGQERSAAVRFLMTNAASDRKALLVRRRSTDATATALRSTVDAVPTSRLTVPVAHAFDAAVGSAPALRAARTATDAAGADPVAVVGRYDDVTGPAIAGGAAVPGAVDDPSLGADLSTFTALAALADGAAAEHDLLTALPARPTVAARTAYADTVAAQNAGLAALRTGAASTADRQTLVRAAAPGTVLAAARAAVTSGRDLDVAAASHAAELRLSTLTGRKGSLATAINGQLDPVRAAASHRLDLGALAALVLLALIGLAATLLARAARSAPAEVTGDSDSDVDVEPESEPTQILIGYQPDSGGEPAASEPVRGRRFGLPRPAAPRRRAPGRHSAARAETPAETITERVPTAWAPSPPASTPAAVSTFDPIGGSSRPSMPAPALAGRDILPAGSSRVCRRGGGGGARTPRSRRPSARDAATEPSTRVPVAEDVTGLPGIDVHPRREAQHEVSPRPSAAAVALADPMDADPMDADPMDADPMEAEYASPAFGAVPLPRDAAEGDDSALPVPPPAEDLMMRAFAELSELSASTGRSADRGRGRRPGRHGRS